MNRCLSRVVLLSTVLCVGPAIVNRLALAEEPAEGLMGSGQSPTLQAVLRALGLADAPVVQPSGAAPAVVASATPPRSLSSAGVGPGAAGGEASGSRMPAEVRQVLQALGLLSADAKTAVAVAPAAATEAAVSPPEPQPPAVAAAPAADAAAPGPSMAPALAPAPAATLAAAPDPVLASPPSVPPVPASSQLRLADRTLVALNESTLDSLRGGFIGEGGLKISFGIERAVYVNGNLVTTTSLNLSELGTLSAGKAAALTLPEVGNRIALIQNGAGNTVLSDLGPRAIGTVIQNTLNGQNIQSLTTINATVNSLGVMKSIEMQRNLRSAITDSLRR